MTNEICVAQDATGPRHGFGYTASFVIRTAFTGQTEADRSMSSAFDSKSCSAPGRNSGKPDAVSPFQTSGHSPTHNWLRVQTEVSMDNEVIRYRGVRGFEGLSAISWTTLCGGRRNPPENA